MAPFEPHFFSVVFWHGIGPDVIHYRNLSDFVTKASKKLKCTGDDIFVMCENGIQDRLNNFIRVPKGVLCVFNFGGIVRIGDASHSVHLCLNQKLYALQVDTVEQIYEFCQEKLSVGKNEFHAFTPEGTTLKTWKPDYSISKFEREHFVYVSRKN